MCGRYDHLIAVLEHMDGKSLRENFGGFVEIGDHCVFTPSPHQAHGASPKQARADVNIGKSDGWVCGVENGAGCFCNSVDPDLVLPVIVPHAGYRFISGGALVSKVCHSLTHLQP